MSVARLLPAAWLAAAIGLALPSAPARGGDCGGLYPFWFSRGQAICCGAEKCGHPYTANPLRFAHRTNAPGCRTSPLELFHTGLSHCPSGYADWNCGGDCGQCGRGTPSCGEAISDAADVIVSPATPPEKATPPQKEPPVLPSARRQHRAAR